MKLMTSRTGEGQFATAGSSKSGSTPKCETRFVQLARSLTQQAKETLVGPMRHIKNNRARGTASQALLTCGWGKPKVELMSDEAGCVQALRAVAAEPDEQPDNRLA